MKAVYFTKRPKRHLTVSGVHSFLIELRDWLQRREIKYGDRTEAVRRIAVDSVRVKVGWGEGLLGGGVRIEENLEAYRSFYVL